MGQMLVLTLQAVILVRRQLSKDLHTNYKSVSIPGACRVLFQVMLQPYGYTVAVKASPIDFVHRLRWEATIYQRLRPIRGTYVPVYLGNIDLKVPYHCDGIAELVHMMLLSFGGKRICQQLNADRASISQQVDISTRALHNMGVLHEDLMSHNLLWNEGIRKVMIDFDRAGLVETRIRPVLRDISSS